MLYKDLAVRNTTCAVRYGFIFRLSRLVLQETQYDHDCPSCPILTGGKDDDEDARRNGGERIVLVVSRPGTIPDQLRFKAERDRRGGVTSSRPIMN
jgi:hypothetical protein